MRYIGVDLHTTQITVCYLKTEEEFEIRKYQLCEIERFVSSLEISDEVAVEATGNTRWFREQINFRVRRIVIVNPRAFEVVRKSVKKTDKNDALNLARFLKADLLPEVRAKSLAAEKVQSLVGSRTKLVRLKTSLINKIHALYVSNGRKLKKSSLASEKGLDRVLNEQFSEIERIEVEIIVEQIRSLKAGIKKLDRVIEEQASLLEGFESLVSMSGIGSLTAGILLSVIGEVKDFASADKLASYFGVVPRVSNSNETVHHGRITKRGSKTGRTALVQSALAAIKKNDYLKNYYNQSQSPARTRKGKNRAGKKVLRNNLQHSNPRLGVRRF